MVKQMNRQDAVSGKEGSVFVVIDGESIEIAELIKFNARIDYTKAEIHSLGRRMKGSKVVGAEGTGSMELYYHVPVFRKMARNYIDTGIAPIFDVQVTNADLSSRAGTQTILVRNIVPDGINLAMLDASSDDVLRDEFDFDFDDAKFLEQFNSID